MHSRFRDITLSGPSIRIQGPRADWEMGVTVQVTKRDKGAHREARVSDTRSLDWPSEVVALCERTADIA
jgi:hypothetical protein